MTRCVIVGASPICEIKRIKTFIKEDDYIIACDGGLNNCKSLEIKPNLIIGDFDSFDEKDLKEYKNIEVIKLPREKDDTDTFFAVKEALRRKYEDFLLLGLIGKRFDHSLCNISVLLFLNNKKKKAEIIDDYSKMIIVDKFEKYISDKYAYFSLMNVDGTAKGVYIENAKYPLKNAQIKSDFQYAISNEVIKGNKASVKVKKGRLLLIKVFA